MIRSVVAVIVGDLIWGFLWVSANSVVATSFPSSLSEGGRFEHMPTLLFFVFFSIALSILAGYLTALIAGRREIAHAIALGILQLAIGIMVTAQNYDLAPLWYHIVFLLLLIPGNISGGYFRVIQKERARYSLVKTA